MRRAKVLATVGLTVFILLAGSAPVSAATFVFDGFSAGGSRVVTASSGPGQGIPEAPVVGSPAHIALQINLADTGPEIPLDATGQFVFGPADGFIVASILVNGSPFDWNASFQPGTGTIILTLDHGAINGLAFNIFDPTGSPRGIQADTATGTFAVQFNTLLYSYDFSGDGFALGTANTFTRLAVPEPSEWALMVVGFGLLGGLMRMQRRRRLTASP